MDLDLSKVLDSLDVIVYVADMETYELVYINEYTRNIFGDITGKVCWQSLQSDQTGPCDFCTNNKLLDARGNPTGEYNWEFRNTTNGRWYDIRDKAIINEDGRPLRLEIATDITHRKHTEQTLKLAEEEWMNTFDAISDSVVVLDLDYQIIKANKATAESFDTTSEDLVGRRCYELFHGNCKPFEGCPHSELLQTQETVTREIYEPTIERYLLVTDAPIFKNGILKASVHIVKDITKRKQAENKLRMTQFSVDRCAEEVFWMEQDARFIYVNDAACEILGYSREELLTMSVFDINPSFPAEKWPEHWQRVKKLGYVILESEHCTKDGRRFPVEVMVNFIKFEDKEYICAFARDITERKKATEDMERIFQASDYLICIASMDGYFRKISPAFSETLGYSEKELMERPFFDFIHPDDRASTLAVVTEKLEKGEAVISFENRYRCKDGTYKWLVWTSRPVVEEGEMFAIAYDITKRKNAENELKASEEKFSKAFRSSPDMIAITRIKDNKLIEVSEGCIRILGFSREEAIGKSATDLNIWIKNEDRDRYIDMLRSRNKVEDFEADLRTKSGKIRSCQFSVELIELEGEAHMLSVIRDITEHKQALKAGHLASIGELAAGIAHEINNPTNSIMLNAEMLLDMPEIEADERSDIAASIRNDSQRITNIVRSLLSFARADTKEKVPVSINQIMRDTLMLTEQQIGRNGINLKISIPQDMPEIIANAQELEQVFINIINNARYALNQKYPQDNSGKIMDISGSMVEIDNRPYMQLVFYDSGTGISGDIIKKVKDPFFTTKPADAGTGLGMSISHGILSDHKGTLEVESEEGEYTRIIIKLPVEVENEPAGSSD